jgi:hypothetical protein
MAPSLSLAQSGSGQSGNCSVPKKEREVRVVDFRVVKSVFFVGVPGRQQMRLVFDAVLEGGGG